MINRFICWFIGHKWDVYPEKYGDAEIRCKRCLVYADKPVNDG